MEYHPRHILRSKSKEHLAMKGFTKMAGLVIMAGFIMSSGIPSAHTRETMWQKNHPGRAEVNKWLSNQNAHIQPRGEEWHVELVAGCQGVDLTPSGQARVLQGPVLRGSTSAFFELYIFPVCYKDRSELSCLFHAAAHDRNAKEDIPICLTAIP